MLIAEHTYEPLQQSLRELFDQLADEPSWRHHEDAFQGLAAKVNLHLLIIIVY